MVAPMDAAELTDASREPGAAPHARAQTVRALLRRHGLSLSGGADDAAWQAKKFVTRARALFWARLAFLFIGLGVLAIDPWAAEFGIRGPAAYFVYVGMLLYTIANYMVVEHPAAGRWVTFSTLCFDTLVIVYLIVASGGLRSPLLATQLMLTTIFVILFPKPLAILPPLLTLPVIAKIDQLLGMSGERVLVDLFTLVWFSALNFVIVYVIVFMNEREDARQREVTQLQGELKDLAVVEERSRLAREIHDGLGASLSGLIIQAEYLHGLAPEELKDEVKELRSTAEEAIDELRRSLKMMREDFDLEQAAADHCRTFEGRSRLPIVFERVGAPRALAAEGQLSLFRVLQEALSNAAKHAAATRVQVKLAFEGHGCAITVKDDGKGFDPTASKHGHYGLLNMRERAKKCGGEVTVRSRPGEGTEICLTVPYREHAPAGGEALG